MKFKALCGLILGLFLSTPALSNATYENEDPYNMNHGIAVNQCNPGLDSSLYFCGAEDAAKVVKFLNNKANFGKNSVLMRFWDKELDLWYYVAVNKTSKKLFYLPMGLRSTTKPENVVSLTFDNGNQICTTGTSTYMLLEDKDYVSYNKKDDQDDTDYCANYNDETGFSRIRKINSKTRKTLSEL